MKNLKLTTILISMILLLSCHDNNELITLNRIVVKDKIMLPLPNKYVIDCNVKIVNEKNKFLAIAEFYPLKKIFIYDLEKKKIISEINVPKNVQNIQYVNADSIWLFYYNGNYYNYDSALVLIDIRGNVKEVHSFYHPNILTLKLNPSLTKGVFNQDSILFLTNNQYSSKIINNNKLFFTAINYNNGKKIGYIKLPIAGYYDIKEKHIIFNQKLFYPYVNDTTFYSYDSPNMYEIDGFLNNKNKFLISFRYNPIFYQWDFITDKYKYFRLASKMIDTIYSFNHPTKSDESAYYLGMFYSKHLNMYVRYALLGEKYSKQPIIIFADSNYNYLGEALYSIDYSIQGEYNNKFYNASIVSDSLQIKFFDFEFKKLNILSFKKQLDSLQNLIIKKENSIYCKITGKKEYNSKYTVDDFMNYLKYKDINDSSLALIIISENACSSCNNYILKFISINQMVFFKFKKKPFYLLYVSDNKANYNTVLENYHIEKSQNLIFEEAKNYNFFNPYSESNPRLVLIKNRRIVSDTIYMPHQLENLIKQLLNFYGYTAE